LHLFDVSGLAGVTDAPILVKFDVKEHTTGSLISASVSFTVL